MEQTKGNKEGTTVLQVSLLLLTILVMSVLIWAGFTGQQELFPLLLGITLTLSMSNLYLLNRGTKLGKWYKGAMIIASLSMVLGLLNLVFLKG